MPAPRLRVFWLPVVLAIACFGVGLRGQESPACAQARKAEDLRHRDALAELQKQILDANNQYNKALIACGNVTSCQRSAADQLEEALKPIRMARSDEDTRYGKTLIDIGNGKCSGGQPAASGSDPTLSPADQSKVYKLSATMNDIASAANSIGRAVGEFVKGLADWAKGTLDFLAQKPGVPLQQMASSLVTYLTNDNAANHRMLAQAG